MQSLKKVLVLSDLHAPYQDQKAFNLFLEVGHSILKDTDVLVTIGDTLDFFSVSSHPKPLDRKTNLGSEIEAGKICLRALERLPPKRKIFLEGNHDRRLANYVRDKAPELYGLVGLKQILDLKAWEFVPYHDFIRVGKMAFTHDVGRSGANAARQSLNDFGGNLTFGHSHRGSVVYGGTVKGETHVCLNVGWLGDLKYIDYIHKAKANRDWQHGFGLVYVQPNGNCHAQFVPVIAGRCVVEGKLYGV